MLADLLSMFGASQKAENPSHSHTVQVENFFEVGQAREQLHVSLTDFVQLHIDLFLADIFDVQSW